MTQTHTLYRPLSAMKLAPNDVIFDRALTSAQTHPFGTRSRSDHLSIVVVVLLVVSTDVSAVAGVVCGDAVSVAYL